MTRVRHQLIIFALALAMAIGPGCGTIDKLKPSAAKVSPGPDALSRAMAESVEIAKQAALTEGGAARILPGDTDGNIFQKERTKSICFSQCPVYGIVFKHFSTIFDLSRQFGM